MATDPHAPELHLDPIVVPAHSDADHRAETEQARRLADRYRLEFVDMDTFRIDQDLFRPIPADLMLRYGFVPSRRLVNAPELAVPSPPPPGPAGARRARRAPVAADQSGRRAEVGDRVDPQEEREQPARAGRSD